MPRPLLFTRPLLLGFGAYAALWLVALLTWQLAKSFPAALLGVVFELSIPVGAAALYLTLRERPRSPVAVGAAASLAFVFWWQLSVFAADLVDYYTVRASLTTLGASGLFVIGLLWIVWLLERSSRYYQLQRFEARPYNPIVAQSLTAQDDPSIEGPAVWNPLDPAAWYYGRRGKKLNQSLVAFTAYATCFFLIGLILSQMQGCQELYEMPAGGGEVAQIMQQVKIQKIIRKKFVVNPYSSIIFDVPPIDEVKLQLAEVTKHAYTVGYGKGAGAGFAGGTSRGKVRFIRLEYSGGDWDQDYGIGADLNMLLEYGIRTKQRVAEKTESRRVSELAGFPIGKAPPVVYLTGQGSISLSNSEVKILQQYLLDKHGMIFGDNGGSAHFHNQFLAMMSRVLPDVRPVPVPLDDELHRIPYPLPFLPIVAPHGGREALGWYKEGRWLCYYHPGDIADAWCDDHAGVRPDVWEACFQLGTNVIFYAHKEQSQWLESRKKE